MNGDDYYGAEDFSGGGFTASAPTESTGGIIATQSPGFIEGLQNVFARFTSRPTDTSSGVSGQLYNAIYAFGAGKLDAARESAARALLASRTGQQFVGAVERERIKQLAPMFILGAVLIFGFAYFMGRR